MNSLLIAIFLAIVVVRGGGTLSAPLFLELLICNIAVSAAGFSMLKISNIKRTTIINFPLLALVSGVFISSFAIYLLCISFNISAGHGFLYVSIISFLIAAIDPKNFIKTIIFPNNRLIDTIVLFFIGIFALCWGWKILASYPTLIEKNFLSTWVDAFIHAMQTARFYDLKAIGHGDIFLTGISPPLYHQGIYILSGALAEITHLPPLVASTGFLLSIGILTLGITI